MATKSSVGHLNTAFARSSATGTRAFLVLIAFLLFFCVSAQTQTIDPKSPSKEYIRLGGRVIAIENGGETVSAPNVPSGPASGVTATLYMFRTGGAVSSKGNKVQYSFDWGDGTSSSWTPPSVTTSFHQWNAPGTYQVTVRARVTSNIAAISPRSGSFTVTITQGELISTPSVPNGPTSGSPSVSYTYSTGQSTSSFGHQVQYRFNWGDGSTSGWLPAGTTSASHSWFIASTYGVTVQARCATDTSVVSAVSNLTVTISGAGETISTPNAPDGPTAGVPATSYTYLLSGATSSLGHAVQYSVDWGDGSRTGFLATGTTSASHIWTNSGSYTVTVQAHCSVDITAVSNTSSITVVISNTNPQIAISGLNFTNQNGTAITMPAPVGTTAINVAWNTNINANCTYGGVTANANGGTSGHFVTRSGLSNGFSDTQTVVCTDVASSSNTASLQVSVAVQNPQIVISGLNFTNQSGTAITMPAPVGTTAINVAWNTNINANCTYGGIAANANGGTSGHFVTRSGLTNGFSDTQTVVCTDVASSSNTASLQVSVAVQNPQIVISGLNFTNQNGTAITMPAPVGTTAINVAWNTNINANCTYGGVTANANGGTSGHFVTRSGLSNGFSDTQTVVCTDVASSSNTASLQVSVAVQNPQIVISGLNFTNQNGTAITMPAPVGTTAINVAWNTNINANCTYGGVTANANGGTSGHFVTRSGLTNGFSDTQTVVCTDVASSSNTASLQVSVAVQNPQIVISGLNFTNQNGTAITMPAPVGTTAINVAWNTNINANCTYGGIAANANGGTSGHFVTRSGLTNDFSDTQTVVCIDVASSSNTASLQVSVAVQNPQIAISGLNFTNQNGTAITMPAPVGTTAINVAWNTNINANCTYGGIAANANGGTSGHFVTRSGLTNGFSDTQTVVCTDVASSSNTASLQVSVAVQNPQIVISGLNFTNQNGTAITMPAPVGTTAINVAWNTNINANCTYGGVTANANGGTSGHFVTRSGLTNGFSDTQTVICTDVASSSNTASLQVSVAVQNPQIVISGLNFTNQNGTVITMPAPVGTTAINVAWNTNINANCTYGGIAANANGGTSGHFVTRSGLTNGFSDTQTVVCTDVASSSNTASLQVSVAVQNPQIVISGLNFTNQNGTAITMPAPVGTTAINVAWNTNINANCTYGGVAANANGGTSGHFVTRSGLTNGFSDTQTVVCTDVASSSNTASLQVSVAVQNPQIVISGLNFTNQNGTAITMPAPVGTTAINVAWNTNINANCTYGGIAANANGGTSGHFVTRSGLTNGFSDTQTVVCTDVASSSNTASLQVSVAVQNPQIVISGLNFTNQNGTAITMPAPVGTTAINVAWNTNINANCTYGGVTANANGGTSGHFVTRSGLTNGFSDTQTVVCTDVASSSNTASLQVSVAVQNPQIVISGLNFTNQNGTAITMPAPVGTTAINVAWNTNINANCTYGGVAANANGGTSGHFVTRSGLSNGFSDTQTVVCTDVASSSNTASLQVSVAVQNPQIVISGLNFTNQNGTAITMPAPVGTTAINVAWNTNINANCTYGGIAANANGGTSGHFVTRSGLTNGFSDTQTVVCTDVASSSNTASLQVSVAVQNPQIVISGLNFTNQNGTAITMPAPVGTTAINVAWNTNINANCTYGGIAANANGGTSGHFVTRSGLTNGFSDTQTVVCTDVASSSNTASLQVSVAVQNPQIVISGLNFTNQNGTGITMPAPVGTTAINVAWNTNINANCTYGGIAANANGGTSGHFVTRSGLTNGFSDTQTVVCTDVASSSNTASLQVSVAVQNPQIVISGLNFTNQNGTAITMPAPVGTTAINVAWNTNINANCTYGGVAANANGGTSGHFVTRSGLTNGFSDTQTVVCTDVASSSNTASLQVSVAVQNPPIAISGLHFTNQNGTAINMPAPAGTTAINVAWNTNINANCTYGGVTANANGGTSGHFVTRSGLTNGFSDTQTVVCTDVTSSSNITSLQVSVSVQNSPITISGLSFTNQNGTPINMPAPTGTTAINVAWNTNINANCTYGGVTANANGGTSGHFVTRSGLSNGFGDTQTIICTDVSNSSNTTSLQVSISVQNSPPIAISGLHFTNQNGTPINMPAPAGTTAINVAWNTNINANCTYGGVTANANGGTSGHFVTRSGLSNGFGDTQTIICTDVTSSSNTTSLQVSVSVQNSPIAISGLNFTNQNGTPINMPAPTGTTAINVAWNTNINANCTYGGITANANGGTSGHFVTRSGLSNGFSDTQTIICTDVSNSSNTTSLQVSVSVQNPPPITISTPTFTNQNGTPINMPAPAGTTAINVVWNTNVNANCTYGGFTANANGGTSGHFVTRSGLSNGFSDTQTIVCTDVNNSSNTTSTSVSIAVSN